MDVRRPAQRSRPFQVAGPVRVVAQISQAAVVDALPPAATSTAVKAWTCSIL